MVSFLKKEKKGITLVEILIVIGIIAFLIVLTMAYFRGQVFKGNDARRKTDIHKIQVAIEEYEKDHNCYPLPQLVTCKPGTGLQPYLEKIPCDPITNASYYYEYENSPCPKWYRLYADLENVQDDSVTPGVGPDHAFNYFASSPNAPDGVYASSSEFYGCRNQACVPIIWDPSRPGPECDPNYQSVTCYGFCDNPNNDCRSWK